MADTIPPIYEFHVVHEKNILIIAFLQDKKPIYEFRLMNKELTSSGLFRSAEPISTETTNRFEKMVEIIQPFSSHSRTDIPIQSLKNIVLSSLDESRTKISMPGVMNLIVSKEKLEIDKEKTQYYRSFKLSVTAENVEFGNFEVDELKVDNECKYYTNTVVSNTLNVNKLIFYSAPPLNPKGDLSISKLTNNGKICVEECIFQGSFQVINNGELDIEKSYSQTEGEIRNNGTWKQEGSLETGKIQNINEGNLHWKNTNWNSNLHKSRLDITGSGEIYFSNVICVNEIDIIGCKKLTLDDSQLSFANLKSPGIVRCVSGKYRVLGFESQVLNFENDWIITDDFSCSPVGEKENGIFIGWYDLDPGGIITHSGKLTFDMIKLVNSIQGEEIFITKRSQEAMKLFDIHKFTSKCVCFKDDEKLKRIHVNEMTPGLEGSSYFH